MFLRFAATSIALALAGPALIGPALAQDAPAVTPQILPDIAQGAEDAPLTVIEYASFTCGHCANFHTTVYPELKAEYIDTGKVRFIQRDIYFDQPGLWAGILARCGGDDKFYPVSGMLFEEQSEWLAGGSGDEIAANLRRIGLKAGMTEEQMTACWNDTAKVEQLIATFQQNATADEVEATPTFMIGDEKVPNQAWDGMREIIEAKLAEVAPAP